MTTQTILIAFGLTMIAGLSTGLGSILAFFTKRSNNKALSGALGLSAGVMVYISFMEMMPQSLHLLSLQNSEQQATIYMLLAFFGGIALIWGIDLLIPEDENPHEMHRVEGTEVQGFPHFPTNELTISSASARVLSRRSFSSILSNIGSYRSSSAAFATLLSIASGESVPRLSSLRRSSSTEGGFMNTDMAWSPKIRLRLTPPLTSMSKSMMWPLSQILSTSDRRVP